MKVGIAASTHPGYKISLEEALHFSGVAAGICYMPDTLDALFNEPAEKTMKRINACIKSGHHSVCDHVVLNLALEDIPKMLAMFLNNEKMYNTSEKSARYTTMKASPAEVKLYQKWISIFDMEIAKAYPNIGEKKRKKLAMENARYLISVFTPATSMLYSVTLRQLNLILYWMHKYIKNEINDAFSEKVKSIFEDFLCTPVSGTSMQVKDFAINDLNDGWKNRSFSLIAKNGYRKEEFGENYCTNYVASFAELAQAQRHRTLKYEFSIIEKSKFKRYHVPPIIKDSEFKAEWIHDMESLKENYPQGMLVYVNERGTCEDFILKCTERLCGETQLEIASQTQKTLKKYMNSVKQSNPNIYNRMLPYSHGARCTFPGWSCKNPCIFGPKYALKRII